jgi:hypothetical protein
MQDLYCDLSITSLIVGKNSPCSLYFGQPLKICHFFCSALRLSGNFSFSITQVMVVEGQNPSGYCLVASRIFDASPLPSLTKLSQEEDPPAKRQAIHLLPQDPVQSEKSHMLCIVSCIMSFCDTIAPA